MDAEWEKFSFVQFDLWSVGVILFELFSELKFENVYYKYYRSDFKTFKTDSDDQSKLFPDQVKLTYQNGELTEDYLPK